MLINLNAAAPESRQVFGYKRDGNTVTVHRWKMSHITGNLYLQEPVADQYGQRYAHIVFLLDGVKIGLDVGMLTSWQINEYSVEDVAARVGFSDADTFKAHIRADMENGLHIRDSYIAFVRQFDAPLADKMQIYKAAFLQRREKQEQERRAELERREKQEQEERARALAEAIAEAEKKLLSGGRIENSEINGNCTFLHLFDKHGIPIAIRSRGWIIDKLKWVVASADGSVTVYFSKTRKNEKISSGFRDAYLALMEKLKAQAAA